MMSLAIMANQALNTSKTETQHPYRTYAMGQQVLEAKQGAASSCRSIEVLLSWQNSTHAVP